MSKALQAIGSAVVVIPLGLIAFLRAPHGPAAIAFYVALLTLSTGGVIILLMRGPGPEDRPGAWTLAVIVVITCGLGASFSGLPQPWSTFGLLIAVEAALWSTRGRSDTRETGEP